MITMNSLLQITSSKVAVSFLVFAVIVAGCTKSATFHPMFLGKLFETAMGVLLR